MSTDLATTSETAEDAEEVPQPSERGTRRWSDMLTDPSSARSKRFFATWGAVPVLLACAAGGLWWHNQHEQSVEASSVAALDAAQKGTAQVLSYEPATVDANLAAAGNSLTGRFKDDFAALARDLIAPTAKKDNVKTRADVVSSSVVSAEDERVVTLVFVNQTTQSNVTPEPRVDGSRLKVTLEKVGDRWLISDLVPV